MAEGAEVAPVLGPMVPCRLARPASSQRQINPSVRRLRPRRPNRQPTISARRGLSQNPFVTQRDVIPLAGLLLTRRCGRCPGRTAGSGLTECRLRCVPAWRRCGLYGICGLRLWYGRGGIRGGDRRRWRAWLPGRADQLCRPGRAGARGRWPAGGAPAGDGDRAGRDGQDPAGRAGGPGGDGRVRRRGVAGRAGPGEGPGAGRGGGGGGAGGAGAAGRPGGRGAGADAGPAAAAAGAG